MRVFYDQKDRWDVDEEGQGSLPHAQIAFEPSFLVSDGINTR
jgi:hypothetical protein